MCLMVGFFPFASMALRCSQSGCTRKIKELLSSEAKSSAEQRICTDKRQWTIIYLLISPSLSNPHYPSPPLSHQPTPFLTHSVTILHPPSLPHQPTPTSSLSPSPTNSLPHSPTPYAQPSPTQLLSPSTVPLLCRKAWMCSRMKERGRTKPICGQALPVKVSLHDMISG